ncbi:MAG: DUF6134 family protein [bacterium]
MLRTLVIASLLNLSAAAYAAAPDEQRWDFNVLLDEQKIGEHSFVVRRQPSPEHGLLKTVSIDADFNVKVLFFNAYSYQHSNRETWQGNCLVALESRTNDNGDNLQVQASTQARQFVVQTNAGTRTYETCPMSFAYWNPALLSAQALINAQTGELLPVEITALGSEKLEVAGQTIPAKHYALKMAEQTIALWYAADDYRWLALETKARGDRTLRYEATSLPAPISPPHQHAHGESIAVPMEQTNAMAY